MNSSPARTRLSTPSQKSVSSQDDAQVRLVLSQSIDESPPLVRRPLSAWIAGPRMEDDVPATVDPEILEQCATARFRSRSDRRQIVGQRSPGKFREEVTHQRQVLIDGVSRRIHPGTECV